jgi:hypothetical protein
MVKRNHAWSLISPSNMWQTGNEVTYKRSSSHSRLNSGTISIILYRTVYILAYYLAIRNLNTWPKAIPSTGRGGLWGCLMLRIPHCLDNRLTVNCEILATFSSIYSPVCTSQEAHSVTIKQSYPRNRPWRSIGLWDVVDPTLSRLDNYLTVNCEILATCSSTYSPVYTSLEAHSVYIK